MAQINVNAITKGKDARSGYYEIGDEIYNNKIEALYQGSLQRKYPRWNFHDAVYSATDWHTRPTKTLAEVYKERAQQLRDKYDYISISFSGGADAWNMLFAFLNNGIHVDEVYTRFALSGTRKYYEANDKVRDPVNYTSEYEYAVKPVLDYVQKNFPLTKVTVDDITESYLEEVTESELLRAGHHIFSGLSVKRCANQFGLTGLDGKKVATIRGSGKVQVFKHNGMFFADFTDAEAWPIDSDYYPDLEYFYWTPDMPEIVVTQAHAMLDYFKAHPELHHLIEKSPQEIRPGVIVESLTRVQKWELLEAYDEIVKEVCYPGWNRNTFQARKNTPYVFYREEDFWVIKEQGRSVQSWKWHLEQYYKSISEAAFYYPDPTDTSMRALRTFRSKYYLVGTI